MGGREDRGGSLSLSTTGLPGGLGEVLGVYLYSVIMCQNGSGKDLYINLDLVNYQLILIKSQNSPNFPYKNHLLLSIVSAANLGNSSI